MKIAYIFLFVCITSNAMHKISNGNGHNGVPDKKKLEAQINQIATILQKLNEIQSRQETTDKHLQQLETQQGETKAVIENLQLFNDQTLKPHLETLLGKLQVKEEDPVAIQQPTDADEVFESRILYFAGGFLAGSLPFLLRYALIK